MTSLGVSLWQFSSTDGGDTIVTNFGIAISSTILGIALRVIFNQLRQDPMEVERTARLQLADAARKVKEELDATVFELQSFRRGVQQSFEEGVVETREYAERVIRTAFEGLKDLPERSAAPIQTASKNTEDAISKLAEMLTGKLKASGETLSNEETRLTTSAVGVRDALASVEQRLRTMQTPEGIIEVKLQPFVSSLTKAINAFSSVAERQMAADKEHQNQLHQVIVELQAGLGSLSQKISAMTTDTTASQRGVVDKLSAVEELQRSVLEHLAQKNSQTGPVASPIVETRRWFSKGGPNVQS